MMNRWEAIEIFHRSREDAIVVHGTGGMWVEVAAKSPSDLNIYSAMPYSTPMGLGVALALPDYPVVVMEGDGSAISGISGLATVANMAPKNFIHIVWDNGVWMSPGTMGTRSHYGPMPTPSGGRTNLEGFAKAAGYVHTTTVNTLQEFESALLAAKRESGPSYIVAKIGHDLLKEDPPRLVGTVEQAINFRRGLINRKLVSANHAGAYKGKGLAGPSAGESIVIPEIDAEIENGPRPSLDKARIIYRGLREAGIDFFVYLPDSANYFVQRLAAADPEITSVSVTREDEGIAIAMGAFMAGRNPVLIMEASGLGLCPLAIAVMAHEQRMGCLLVYAHNFALGETRDVHACTKWVTDPMLNALMVPNIIVQDTKDAPRIFKQAYQTVRGQMTPVAVCLPLHVLWDD
jgi:thiamine pyrophosphate-dependent acetolactate synthase large subunit-like protein